MAEFTAREKLEEADREVAMRRKVYPKQIARGDLSMAKANRQIEIMRAIAQDYYRAAIAEEAEAEARRRKQTILSGG